MLKKIKIPLIVILTAVISIGLTMIFLKPQSNDAVQFQKLYSTYDKIKQKYYTDVDNGKLEDGAIQGMIQALDDPYTTYMDEEEAASFQEVISSSFEGIGAEVTEKDGNVTIVSPIKGSPAEKAGIKPHDIILKVDDKGIEEMSVNEAVLLIRGEKGTKVNLLIERAGVGELNISITRDTIPVETVHYEVIDGNIGKIQITNFSETTGQELADALNSLTEQNVKGLVVDLRQNPGGLMDQAIAMSELFVSKGKNILQVENKDGSREVVKARNSNPVNLPTVVVIDNGTASAGEIMAAALNQSEGIPLVGEKTFGKGTIQQAESFADGSSIKFTVAKWLTPDGTWIHEKGIEPTVEVKLPEWASLPFINPEKPLKEGDAGPEVKVVEQMFTALGYKNIKVDSYYEKGLAAAVSAFQKEKELDVSGQISGETTIAVMEALREKLQAEDSQIKKAVEVLREQ